MTDDLDDRVTCLDCGNLDRGYCTNARAAGLTTRFDDKAEIGPTLAALLQRCNGFRPSARVRSVVAP